MDIKFNLTDNTLYVSLIGELDDCTSSFTRDAIDEKLRNYNYQNVVFDKECGKKYPTIHHLIKKLMDSAAGADIRHIYIACAWLAAHRGHFLLETESENIEELTDIEPLYDEFEQWFRDNELDLP